VLTVISIDEAKKWDGIVKSFENYDAYYLGGYSKAFQLHGDGEPNLFYYEDSYIRAMNVVMIRDIEQDENFHSKLSKGQFFDITTPYGYGGFLIEGTTTEDSLRCLDAEYSSFCRSKGIISEFVRFHPILNNSEALKGIYNITKLGTTIPMNIDLRELMWGDLTSSNRGRVRKARKEGVEILWGRDIELFKEFAHLYNSTMERNNARDYYYFADDFYSSILNDLKDNALIFYAAYQSKIIAMSIILFANHQMHYHLGASDKEYHHLAPTNLLFYEAACWGRENGYKTFHLGGGVGSNEDSLYKFKSTFNRNSNNNFEIGSKIFDENQYKELVEMRKVETGIDTRSGFFPKYRGIFSDFDVTLFNGL